MFFDAQTIRISRESNQYTTREHYLKWISSFVMNTKQFIFMNDCAQLHAHLWLHKSSWFAFHIKESVFHSNIKFSYWNPNWFGLVWFVLHMSWKHIISIVFFRCSLKSAHWRVFPNYPWNEIIISADLWMEQKSKHWFVNYLNEFDCLLISAFDPQECLIYARKSQGCTKCVGVSVRFFLIPCHLF